MAKSEQRQNTNKTEDIALKELESIAAKKTKQNKRHYRTRKTKIQSIFLK